MRVIDESKYLNKLFIDNKKEIAEYNAEFFPKVAVIGAITTLIAFVSSFFHSDLALSRNMYAVSSFICCCLYLFAKIKKPVRFAVVGLYIEFITLFLLVLYISVFTLSDRQAASMLIVLSIFPMLFIDKPQRILTLDVVFYLIHTFLSFQMKGEVLGKLDLINGLIATMAGCFLGWFIILTRVQALNFERLLIVEKETDELTGLHNRRKLFWTIGQIEKCTLPRPSGVFMIDIDYFKQYNDRNGHAAGDNCLRSYGKMLQKRQWNTKVEFYRYGGEEFVAFIWDANVEELSDLAEKIRQAAALLPLAYGNITNSIGYVYCDDEQILNYETWIERADEAVYKAKKNGRNCVVGYK